MDIPEPRPKPRYGQSQLYLDENHILMLGGCGGPTQVYHDVWLLVMRSLTEPTGKFPLEQFHKLYLENMKFSLNQNCSVLRKHCCMTTIFPWQLLFSEFKI